MARYRLSHDLYLPTMKLAAGTIVDTEAPVGSIFHISDEDARELLRQLGADLLTDEPPVRTGTGVWRSTGD